jgi:hypothetical protein
MRKNNDFTDIHLNYCARDWKPGIVDPNMKNRTRAEKCKLEECTTFVVEHGDKRTQVYCCPEHRILNEGRMRLKREADEERYAKLSERMQRFMGRK